MYIHTGQDEKEKHNNDRSLNEDGESMSDFFSFYFLNFLWSCYMSINFFCFICLSNSKNICVPQIHIHRKVGNRSEKYLLKKWVEKKKKKRNGLPTEWSVLGQHRVSEVSGARTWPCRNQTSIWSTSNIYTNSRFTQFSAQSTAMSVFSKSKLYKHKHILHSFLFFLNSK